MNESNYATIKTLFKDTERKTNIVVNNNVSNNETPNHSLTWTESVQDIKDPKVWGPIIWTSYHITASHYPENPSPIVKERMKWRIKAIPYELPCEDCRRHASSFIESKSDEELNNIVSSKDNLIKFFVDFHNKVNERYGKPLWSHERAKKAYSGKVKIKHLKTD